MHYCRIADDAHFTSITESLIGAMRLADLGGFARLEGALLLYTSLVSDNDDFRNAELQKKEGMFPDHDFNPVSYVRHARALLTQNEF